MMMHVNNATHLFLCVSVRALPWNMSYWNGVALMAVKVARRWKTVSPRFIVPFLPFSLCYAFVVQFPQSLQMRAISWSYLSAVQGRERNILPDGWVIVRRPRTRQTVPHPPNHVCPAQITDPPTPPPHPPEHGQKTQAHTPLARSKVYFCP